MKGQFELVLWFARFLPIGLKVVNAHTAFRKVPAKCHGQAVLAAGMVTKDLVVLPNVKRHERDPFAGAGRTHGALNGRCGSRGGHDRLGTAGAAAGFSRAANLACAAKATGGAFRRCAVQIIIIIVVG